MDRIFIVIALLLQLCMMIRGSPCSEYYTYLSKRNIGRIEIPSPPRDVQYHLRVGFNTQPLIHRHRPIARLEIVQPIEETIGAVQQGRSLLYHIHFPVDQAIPRLTKIWFNDQQLCPNPEETDYLRTTAIVEQMYLSPSLSPYLEPSLLISSSYQDSSINVNMSFTNYLSEEISNKIIPKTIRTKKSAQNNNYDINNDNNNDNECGILDIHHGQQTSKQWPWLVLVYSVHNKEDYSFRCPGSILTTKHVITAAHCMSSVSNVRPNALVMLRTFNMTQGQKLETIRREIASYKIHPDYTHLTNADSDLAILTLKIPIEFSPFIKPVCLWSGPTNLKNVINRIGYIVKWGMNTLEHYPEELNMTGVPIVDQETCRQSHRIFSSLTSERTFCAGWRNDSHCNVISGAGLVLFNNTTNRYQLRGVISRALILPTAGSFLCDPRHYVVYVDVAKYIPWIQEQISMENKSTSAEPTSQTDSYNNNNNNYHNRFILYCCPESIVRCTELN